MELKKPVTKRPAGGASVHLRVLSGHELAADLAWSTDERGSGIEMKVTTRGV